MWPQWTIWQDAKFNFFCWRSECSCFPFTAVEFPLTQSCSFSLQVNVLHSKKRCEVLETVSFVGLVTFVCVCVCVCVLACVRACVRACVWEWVCKSLSGWLAVCMQQKRYNPWQYFVSFMHETFIQCHQVILKQSLIVCFKQKYWFHLPL